MRSQKFLRILRALEALEVLRDYMQAAVIRHCYVDYRRGIAAQRAYVDLGYRIARGGYECIYPLNVRVTDEHIPKPRVRKP